MTAAAEETAAGAGETGIFSELPVPDLRKPAAKRAVRQV